MQNLQINSDTQVQPSEVDQKLNDMKDQIFQLSNVVAGKANSMQSNSHSRIAEKVKTSEEEENQ